MATTLDDKDSRLEAVKAGANDYLSKPIDQTEFNIRVEGLLRLKASRDEVRGHMALLGKVVEERTNDLREALAGLRKSSSEVVLRLSTAAEFKDDDTAAHIKRMSLYAALLAKRCGLPDGEVQLLQEASPMHDIGKIGIPDAILLKPGKLTPQEWEVMKRHVEYGAKILGDSDLELIAAAREVVWTHHERFDGSGYPKGLKGEGIPLSGRICAVADVFDALTSKRPYKEAFPLGKALGIMVEGRGAHFDPALLDLFLDSLTDVKAIMADHPD